MSRTYKDAAAQLLRGDSLRLCLDSRRCNRAHFDCPLRELRSNGSLLAKRGAGLMGRAYFSRRHCHRGAVEGRENQSEPVLGRYVLAADGVRELTLSTRDPGLCTCIGCRRSGWRAWRPASAWPRPTPQARPPSRSWRPPAARGPGPCAPSRRAGGGRASQATATREKTTHVAWGWGPSSRIWMKTRRTTWTDATCRRRGSGRCRWCLASPRATCGRGFRGLAAYTRGPFSIEVAPECAPHHSVCDCPSSPFGDGFVRWPYDVLNVSLFVHVSEATVLILGLLLVYSALIVPMQLSFWNDYDPCEMAPTWAPLFPTPECLVVELSELVIKFFAGWCLMFSWTPSFWCCTHCTVAANTVPPYSPFLPPSLRTFHCAPPYFPSLNI